MHFLPKQSPDFHFPVTARVSDPIVLLCLFLGCTVASAVVLMMCSFVYGQQTVHS